VHDSPEAILFCQIAYGTHLQLDNKYLGTSISQQPCEHRCLTFFVSDVKECLIKFLFHRTKRETVVLVSGSSCQKNHLKHGKCQVVVILPCHHELTCILSIVSRESLKVFASILRRMTSFDRCLEVLEAFN
jgi:hypothetical protein